MEIYNLKTKNGIAKCGARDLESFYMRPTMGQNCGGSVNVSGGRCQGRRQSDVDEGDERNVVVVFGRDDDGWDWCGRGWWRWRRRRRWRRRQLRHAWQEAEWKNGMAATRFVESIRSTIFVNNNCCFILLLLK